VHLAEPKDIDKIKRSGIKPAAIHSDDHPLGVFCMPVINDFFATHQWARELMRFGKKNLLGVYFRVPDAEMVWYGRFNERHRHGDAAKASLAFNGRDDKLGFQVIVPRKIHPQEVFRVKSVPPLGWRFSPNAKGRKPCLCPACIGAGKYGSNKLLERQLETYKKRLRQGQNENERIDALNGMAELISDHRLKLEGWEKLLVPEFVTNGRTLMAVGGVVFGLQNEAALKRFVELLARAAVDVQAWAAAEIMHRKGTSGRELLGELLQIPEVMREVHEYEESMEEDDGIGRGFRRTAAIRPAGSPD
jgi:hypothetical protein